MVFRPGRWRRRGPVVAALAAVLLAAPNVVAYHQLVTPPDDPDGIGDCLNTAAAPCIRWKKTASNLSIHVDVYLGSGLDLGYINLKTDARNAMADWTALPARNPFLDETTSTSGDEITVSTGNLGVTTYAQTTVAYDSTSPWRINHADMVFNTAISWNRTESYSCDPQPFGGTLCHADARKVATHEFGHANGLGHVESNVTAIMRQGPVTWHTIRQDDQNGIVAIYGAYP